MLLFILGVVEMFVVAYWTKTVAESRTYMSGLVTVVNVLIWFYVLRIFVDDLDNWYLVVSYALGCAVGTMLSSYLSNFETARKSRKRKQASSKLENHSLVTE
ncbi:MAG: DUF5698 domain-containing protein [bacterium]